MTDNQKCCCSADTGVVLACSGGSNVGQITNEAAKVLDSEGLARFFCLAGVGGHISGMVASVQGAARVLVLDGCPIGCAKTIMEEAGLTEYEYLVVTGLGIDKNHDFDVSADQITSVVSQCRARLGAI